MLSSQLPQYQCEICEHVYGTEEAALECESRPISGDKGVKVGDRVRITQGEGVRRFGTVVRRWIYDMNWGHYAAKRYWHTVGLSADLDGSWGTRQLTMDDYELVS